MTKDAIANIARHVPEPAAATAGAVAPNPARSASRPAVLRHAVCGGRRLRESREPAFYVLLLLCARRGQIVSQLVFSLIDSTATKQYLGEEQSRIRKLTLRLTQHLHGFKRVAFLRG